MVGGWRVVASGSDRAGTAMPNMYILKSDGRRDRNAMKRLGIKPAIGNDMDANFAILWHSKSNGEFFYIRAVKPDGTFYGERRRATEINNVEGAIPAEEWDRCCKILDRIASGPPIAPIQNRVAKIARWNESLSDAVIVAHYLNGDEEKSDDGGMFLELLGILERRCRTNSPSPQ